MNHKEAKTCASSSRVLRPLFQAGEGGLTPTLALSAKRLCIDRIPFSDAVRLNREWHSRLPRFQSGFIKNQKNFPCFGAEFGGLVFAVAIWSNPLARELPQREWLELRRLATAPDAPRNTCSRMLRVMELLLLRLRPEVIRLISYQDESVHTGGIYKAAGWSRIEATRGHEWSCSSRPRPKSQSAAPKTRWEKVISR